MALLGTSLVGHHDLPDDTTNTFRAFDPRARKEIEPAFVEATPEQIDHAITLAQEAALSYGSTTPQVRAGFLHLVADKVEALGDVAVQRTAAETAVAPERLAVELKRTASQIRMFADVVRRGEWRRISIVGPAADAWPLPRPDMRTHRIPLGPVAVFGASNFPFLYSVAGGDTASALAAGCPVVFKAHPSHPGASELVGTAIREAVSEAGLHEGVFTLLTGASNALGERIVTHSAIKAVAFTGSEGGGMALVRLGQSRPEPIPVFCEMTSVNPNLVFPHALETRHDAIVEGFVRQLSVGVGQMCLTPGMIIARTGEGFDQLRARLLELVAGVSPQPMLNRRTYEAYCSRVEQIAGLAGVLVAYAGERGDDLTGTPYIFEISAADFIARPDVGTEIFGPAAVLVRAESIEEMHDVIRGLRGQLSGTLHIDDEDVEDASPFVPSLEQITSRIIVNGYSNAVSITDASVHGGPFPATSDSRFTAVGPQAVDRFLRPVAYQNFPAELLPAPLLDSNPTRAPRQIDGRLTLAEPLSREEIDSR